MRFRLIETILLEDIEAVKRQFPKISDEEFNKILNLDPTYKGNDSVGKFTKWMLSQLNKGNIYFDNEDDILTITNTGIGLADILKMYEKALKNTDVNKDINSFKTAEDLVYALNDAKEVELTARQKERQMRKNFKDAKLVYEDDDWYIFVPQTYESSCALGKGSGWCTAHTETRDHYDGYLKKGGQYYVLISKFQPEEKYQFHFETKQFFGAGTNPGGTPNHEYSVEYNDIVDKYPKLREFFDKEGYIDAVAPNSPENQIRAYFDNANRIEGDYVTTWISYSDFADYIVAHNEPLGIPISNALNCYQSKDFYQMQDSIWEGDFIDNWNDYIYGEHLVKLNGSAYTSDFVKESVDTYIGKKVFEYLCPDIDSLWAAKNSTFPYIIMSAINECLADVDIAEKIIKRLFRFGGVDAIDGHIKIYTGLTDISYDIQHYVPDDDDFNDGESLWRDEYAIEWAIETMGDGWGELDDVDDDDVMQLYFNMNYLDRKLGEIDANPISLLARVFDDEIRNKYINELIIAIYDYCDAHNINIDEMEDYAEEVEQPKEDDDSLPF